MSTYGREKCKTVACAETACDETPRAQPPCTDASSCPAPALVKTAEQLRAENEERERLAVAARKKQMQEKTKKKN